MTRTGIHHNIPSAIFALRRLTYVLTHPQRKAR